MTDAKHDLLGYNFAKREITEEEVRALQPGDRLQCVYNLPLRSHIIVGRQYELAHPIGSDSWGYTIDVRDIDSGEVHKGVWVDWFKVAAPDHRATMLHAFGVRP